MNKCHKWPFLVEAANKDNTIYNAVDHALEEPKEGPFDQKKAAIPQTIA